MFFIFLPVGGYRIARARLCGECKARKSGEFQAAVNTCYLYGDTSAGYCGSAASNSGTLSPTAAASGSSGACCAAPIDARHAACAFSGSACENKRAVSVCDNRVQTNVGKTGTAFLISQWAALLVRLCAQEKITQRCAGKQSKTGGISGKLRRGRGGEPYSAAAMGIL